MTESVRSSNWWNPLRLISLCAGLLAILALFPAGRALASTPDWMRAAGNQALPSYPDDTEAVVLLDEQVTSVKDTGEIDTVYRRVYKILRTEGREFGTVHVYFDSETRLAFLKGWSLTDDAKEYEVKEKDAVETTPFGGALFQDTHLKILVIPAAEPGSLVGYEFQQRGRPAILQDSWSFQHTIPVRRSRFVLQLPAGWEFTSRWLHYASAEPQSGGSNRWVWELENIPGIEHESSMPAWLAMAGRLGVTYFPSGPARQGANQKSWDDVGRWYTGVTADRRKASPEIRQKALALSEKAATWLDKVRALASFVQSDIRYVAVEIGVGGFQPHAAAEVFTNRYGDCKDKATLLSAMLGEIGVKSHYVLVQTSRGVIAPEFPSPLGFNHAIVAIGLPAEIDSTGLHAVVQDERLGKLLLFDPTDSRTPLGFLPPDEQDNQALLVQEAGGALVNMPLVAPAYNRIVRQGWLTLSPTGSLSGKVTEIRTGAIAVDLKSRLLSTVGVDRAKILENLLAGSLSGFVLISPIAENLESPDASLIIHYSFTADKYAQTIGNLLLVRPRVLGVKSEDVLEGKPRKYPLEFPYTSLQSDGFEITLPSGYVVDELPLAITLDGPVSAYRSKAEVKGNVLAYQRVYEVKHVQVPLTQIDELRRFFRQVATDERALAVLKRTVPPAPEK